MSSIHSFSLTLTTICHSSAFYTKTIYRSSLPEPLYTLFPRHTDKPLSHWSTFTMKASLPVYIATALLLSSWSVSAADTSDAGSPIPQESQQADASMANLMDRILGNVNHAIPVNTIPDDLKAPTGGDKQAELPAGDRISYLESISHSHLLCRICRGQQISQDVVSLCSRNTQTQDSSSQTWSYVPLS